MAFKSTYTTKSTIENPEALFYDLRNRKVEGLLSHQADVLRVYAKEAMKKSDVAMELPTGSGKTLIGLVTGEYRRRAYHERVVYLCPTKQLVHQVVEEARNKYGINTLAFTGSQTTYDPRAKAEYTNSEAIAVTTYSSLFNTRPFFYNPNFIILDDAHASENYIAKHWSLSISRKNHSMIYSQLIEIFKDAMALEQYQRMQSSSPSPNDKSWVEKIPTLSFISKQNQIIPFLDEATIDIPDLEHNWSVLREHLSACHVYINWNSLLIRPIIPPTTTKAAFSSANQRLYMSATLGLGGELERITGQSNIHRIKAPEGWDKHGVGRRLFFFPGTSLKDADCEKLVFDLVDESQRALILVPDNQSADHLISRFTSETDRVTFQARDIEQTKTNFTSNSNAVAILANRYDGINLSGEECRLEIMQGLPDATNLHERFLETRMAASLLLKDRVRTRIVQAIGRCTRSATDYSTVCILGDELQDRLLQKENIRLYHPELQAELQFGYEESKRVDGINDFIEMYKIFLNQSDEWREADAQIVARREDTDQIPDPIMDQLQKAVKHELNYQNAMWAGDYQGALGHANKVASELSGDNLKGYRGFWYYLAGSAAWLAAQSDFSFFEIARSRFAQAANCTSSVTWLRNIMNESDGISEEMERDHHISFLVERLEFQLERMGTSSDRKFDRRINEIIKGLEDNTDGNRFEHAHLDLGLLLGYNAGNTEEDAGPDPWWIAGNDFCLVAEDYTQTDGKKPIPVHKVRQINDHSTWIEQKVTGLSEETEYIRVIITPSTTVEKAAITIARNDVAYWNQKDFLAWANKALHTIRTLRLDFTGPGNESWRAKAISAYRNAGLDPASLKVDLQKSLLQNLQKI